MSWKIGDNRNLFLKSKSKLGLYLVVLTTPKTPAEKLTLTVVEIQQMPDIEKTDSREKKSCLKWTMYKAGKKYVWTSRLIQTNWILPCSVTETIYTSKIMKLIWNWQNTSHFWQNEFISWATLTYSTSGALYWMKQLFIIKTNSVKIGCFFLMSIFRLYSGKKMSSEHNSVRKNLFLSACFSWDSRLSLREMHQKFIFGGTIGYGDSYLEFCIPSFQSI